MHKPAATPFLIGANVGSLFANAGSLFANARAFTGVDVLDAGCPDASTVLTVEETATSGTNKKQRCVIFNWSKYGIQYVHWMMQEACKKCILLPSISKEILQFQSMFSSWLPWHLSKRDKIIECFSSFLGDEIVSNNAQMLAGLAIGTDIISKNWRMPIFVMEKLKIDYSRLINLKYYVFHACLGPIFNYWNEMEF